MQLYSMWPYTAMFNLFLLCRHCPRCLAQCPIDARLMPAEITVEAEQTPIRRQRYSKLTTSKCQLTLTCMSIKLWHIQHESPQLKRQDAGSRPQDLTISLTQKQASSAFAYVRQSRKTSNYPRRKRAIEHPSLLLKNMFALI